MKKKEKWRVWLFDDKSLDADFNKYLARKTIIKIKPSHRISKSHLNKAFHNIDFANFTLDNQNKINKRIEDENYSDWVIIISYYSMYHAALSLLYKIGFKTSTHTATICVLCKECLGKTLEEKDIEKLSKLFEIREKEIKEIGLAKERREKASYSGSISFEKHLAEITLEDAKDFVNKIANIIER